MLRPCSKKEFEYYSESFYKLAMDLSASCYPTYCDGIKTKEMFYERCLEAIGREDEELLLFEHGGEVRGMIHYFWLPEDRYLEILGCNIAEFTDIALAEFLEYLAARFRGYEAYFGFPEENVPAVRLLSERGFEVISKDFNNTAYPDRLETAGEGADLIRICRENFALFSAVHRQTEDDMYYTARRILEDFENWSIFVKQDRGAPCAAVCSRKLDEGWFEIFGVDIEGGRDTELFKELVKAALLDSKQMGGRFMTLCCEEEYEQSAKECGFIPVGRYLCFKTRFV